jgi:hypothetical protein
MVFCKQNEARTMLDKKVICNSSELSTGKSNTVDIASIIAMGVRENYKTPDEDQSSFGRDCDR